MRFRASVLRTNNERETLLVTLTRPDRPPSAGSPTKSLATRLFRTLRHSACRFIKRITICVVTADFYTYGRSYRSLWRSHNMIYAGRETLPRAKLIEPADTSTISRGESRRRARRRRSTREPDRAYRKAHIVSNKNTHNWSDAITRR